VDDAIELWKTELHSVAAQSATSGAGLRHRRGKRTSSPNAVSVRPVAFLRTDTVRAAAFNLTRRAVYIEVLDEIRHENAKVLRRAKPERLPHDFVDPSAGP
jgi:hypothetical protein